MFKAIESYLSVKKSGLITIAFPFEHQDMQPFIWENYKAIPNYTYRINLEQISDGDILQMASPEKRNEQKKALKDGVNCVLSYDYTLTLDMVKHTFERKQQALNNKLLSNILNEFSTPENSYSFVSYLNKKAIAASYVLYNKDTAYYLLGGYDPSNKHNGARVMALFDAIMEAKKRGIKNFDFEGSILPEVEKYFRAFAVNLYHILLLRRQNS